MSHYIDSLLNSSIYAGSIGSVLFLLLAIVGRLTGVEVIQVLTLVVVTIFATVSIACIIVNLINITRYKGDKQVVYEKQELLNLRRLNHSWEDVN